MDEISPRSRRTAALLAGFLGIFGIHRLYLGKNGTAMVLLILGIAACSITGIYFSVLPSLGYLNTGYFDLGMLPVAAITCFGIAGTWAIVDLVVILIGKMRDREKQKVKNW